MWDEKNFTRGFPVLPHEDAQDLLPVDCEQTQFSLVSSLPIAAAEFRQTSDEMQVISFNPLFEALLIDARREPGLVLEDKDKCAIVSTILPLARAFGLKTTAEGIEIEQISNALKKLG